MTADLAGFLLAQLDADAAKAQAATPGEWLAERGLIRNAKGDPPIALTHVDRHADADHIALHDPAFELDRIAALRAMVQLHRPVPMCCAEHTACRSCKLPFDDADGPCPTLLALAQPYRGRPRWRDEWGTG